MMLLTAFGPFETRDGELVSPNPSALVAERVARERTDLRYERLPVAFDRTRAALTALLDEYRPDAWLGLGVAVRRTTVDLETIALNVAHTLGVDNEGRRPIDRPIEPGAPLAYRTSIDVPALVATLTSEGWPVAQSHHAGTFLCNQSYWAACHHRARTGHPRRALFVHIPPAEVLDIADGAAIVHRICNHLGGLDGDS